MRDNGKMVGLFVPKSLRNAYMTKQNNKSHINPYQNIYKHATYTRTFRGRPKELNFDANFLTDVTELRSNSIASTFAFGTSLMIASLVLCPTAMFLTPIIT